MNASTILKSFVAALAVAGSIGFLAAPAASAVGTTPDQFGHCRITDDDSIQQLAQDLTLDEGEMVNLVNDFRVQHRLSPISVSDDLARAAVVATQDSVLRGFSPADHVDSLGRGLQERLDNCEVWDYTYSAEINYYRTGGEVSQSAGDAISFWTLSPEHRAILLDPDLTKMGIALGYNGEIGQVQDWNRVHWTIVFTN